MLILADVRLKMDEFRVKCSKSQIWHEWYINSFYQHRETRLTRHLEIILKVKGKSEQQESLPRRNSYIPSTRKHQRVAYQNNAQVGRMAAKSVGEVF